jgi:hypothetical protein
MAAQIVAGHALVMVVSFHGLVHWERVAVHTVWSRACEAAPLVAGRGVAVTRTPERVAHARYSTRASDARVLRSV